MISVVFLSCLFVAVVHLGSLLPFFFKLRSVFYRERLSYMYPAEVHALRRETPKLPKLRKRNPENGTPKSKPRN